MEENEIKPENAENHAKIIANKHACFLFVFLKCK